MLLFKLKDEFVVGKEILVCGGAGYIGTHTCIELLEAGYNVIVVDNLSNSKHEALKRVEIITSKNITFIKADICDEQALTAIFDDHEIEAVLHLAGLKSVGESVDNPLDYYHNNITGTLVLLGVMKTHNVKKIVFSSSATVYGVPASLPITEDFPVSTTNPYGSSKLFIENILKDLHDSDPKWNISILRYFNPVGAHKSGLIGEDPNGIPNNLMPYILQVAVGKLDKLSVYGNDYPTKDGTGVRDYIHVVDLAKGHIKALIKLEQFSGCTTHNLGTGHGYTVLEMIEAVEEVSGEDVPYEIVARRKGDIGACYSDTSLAKDELNWVAEKNLKEMCEDSWRWQVNNPQGY